MADFAYRLPDVLVASVCLADQYTSTKPLSFHLEHDLNHGLMVLSAFSSSFPNAFYADIFPNNILHFYTHLDICFSEGQTNISFIHSFKKYLIECLPYSWHFVLGIGEGGTRLRWPPRS